MVPSQIPLGEWNYCMRTKEKHRVDILLVVAILEYDTRVQRTPWYLLTMCQHGMFPSSTFGK